MKLWLKLLIAFLISASLSFIYSASSHSKILMIISIISIVGVGLLFYFLPTVWACEEKHRNAVAIGVLNLFLGWTFIGWVICVVWASIKDKPQNTVTQATENIQSNKYDDIRKLKELQDTGAISEEEFNKEKEKILNG